MLLGISCQFTIYHSFFILSAPRFISLFFPLLIRNISVLHTGENAEVKWVCREGEEDGCDCWSIHVSTYCKHMGQQRKIVVKKNIYCLGKTQFRQPVLCCCNIACVIFKSVNFSFCRSLWCWSSEWCHFLFKKDPQKTRQSCCLWTSCKNNCRSCLEYSTVFSVLLLKTFVNHRTISFNWKGWKF